MTDPIRAEPVATADEILRRFPFPWRVEEYDGRAVIVAANGAKVLEVQPGQHHHFAATRGQRRMLATVIVKGMNALQQPLMGPLVVSPKLPPPPDTPHNRALLAEQAAAGSGWPCSTRPLLFGAPDGSGGLPPSVLAVQAEQLAGSESYRDVMSGIAAEVFNRAFEAAEAEGPRTYQHEHQPVMDARFGIVCSVCGDSLPGEFVAVDLARPGSDATVETLINTATGEITGELLDDG